MKEIEYFCKLNGIDDTEKIILEPDVLCLVLRTPGIGLTKLQEMIAHIYERSTNKRRLRNNVSVIFATLGTKFPKTK